MEDCGVGRSKGCLDYVGRCGVGGEVENRVWSLGK